MTFVNERNTLITICYVPVVVCFSFGFYFSSTTIPFLGLRHPLSAVG